MASLLAALPWSDANGEPQRMGGAECYTEAFRSVELLDALCAEVIPVAGHREKRVLELLREVRHTTVTPWCVAVACVCTSI